MIRLGNDVYYRSLTGLGDCFLVAYVSANLAICFSALLVIHFLTCLHITVKVVTESPAICLAVSLIF